MEYREIDYYGVAFDHLVPPDDIDPEVLQINIIEVDDDEGEYVRQHLRFAVDPREYTGVKVLAGPLVMVAVPWIIGNQDAETALSLCLHATIELGSSYSTASRFIIPAVGVTAPHGNSSINSDNDGIMVAGKSSEPVEIK